MCKGLGGNAYAVFNTATIKVKHVLCPPSITSVSDERHNALVIVTANI